MQESEIQKLLDEGIAAAKAAQPNTGPAEQKRIRRLSSTTDPQKERARQLLQKVTELDDTNLRAWLWLSTVSDDLNDQRLCLTNALLLDPHHKAAQAGMELVEKQIAAEKEKNVPPLPAPPSPPAAAPEPPPAESPIEPVPQTGQHSGCPFCSHSIGSMDMTCPNCKLPLVMDCPQCTTLMDVEWSRCTNCDFEMGDYHLGAIYFAQLGAAYQQRGRAVKAAEALAVAEKLEPDQPDLYRLMGQVQADLGKTSAAVASLEKAIELEPDQAGPYLTLGKVLQKEGHWRQAEKVYRQANKILPKSSEPHFALADLFFQRNQPGRAQKHLKKVIQLDSQHGAAWTLMGQIHESQKNRGAAIRAYRRAEPWVEPDSYEGKLVQERLKVLKPKLPKQLGQSWIEFVRQTAGPILVCVLALLLDSGLRPWGVTWLGWLALLLAVIGSVMWVSGYSLPQNPFICAVVGQRGLGKSERPVLTYLGAAFWLVAMAIILLPIGQTYPEPPL